jgi:hypothetical protein
VGIAVNASAAEGYSGPIRVIGIISATARSLTAARRGAECQARWLARPEHHDYFSGPVHLARNRARRARYPGYWRKSSPPRIAHKERAVLIRLIAHLVGTPQPDDIVRATERLLRLGQDILAMSEGLAPAPP